MSTRRETFFKRCPICRINENGCICAELVHYNNKTSLSIIMHYKELALTSNTALLAQKSLSDCKIYFRGHPSSDMQMNLILPQNKKSYILFPSDDAIPLEDILDKDIHLIIPDGTWRQAKKFHRREPILKDLPLVSIKASNPSRYRLRTQKDENGLCTLEAIAYALGILEGKEAESALLKNLDIMVNKVMESRAGSLEG